MRRGAKSAPASLSGSSCVRAVCQQCTSWCEARLQADGQSPGAMNMLHVLVVVLTLLAFMVRWHYVMASIKARSVESSSPCRGRTNQSREARRPRRPRSAATLRLRALSTRPPYKRDPDIFVDNEQIGQQPRVDFCNIHT